MKLKLRPILYVTAGMLAGAATFAGFAFRETNKDEATVEVKEDGRLQYKWFSPELPKTMTFAGERVPLERYEIREQLDRELLYNYYAQYSTLYILKLSSRYFPEIERRLRANGVPDDFKYLCVAESALQNQTSRAGAVGFWQFMPATGPSYGLEINDDVDERYHVEKSTDAACKYLKQAYDKFGSWTSAAASYNCGMGGFNNHSTFQQQNNYYDVMLPEETMRYIFRILALKHIISESQKFGFMVQNIDAYKPVKTRTVTVNASVPNLAEFAIANGTTYRMLKQLNPWLRSRALPVKSGKSYEVKLPAEG